MPSSWPSHSSEVLAFCTCGYAVDPLRTLLTPPALSSPKTSFSDPAAPHRNPPWAFLSHEHRNFSYNSKMPKKTYPVTAIVLHRHL